MSISLSDYARNDAIGLADLIRSRDVSASEVRDAAVRAIEKVNPQLNAVIDIWDETDPLSVADETGPFAGIPLLLKDFGAAQEGQLNEMGSRLAKGLRAPTTSALVERFKRAGLAPLGRTAVPEFAFNCCTESLLTGATRNPWNLDYSPAGSSGGSAAAVAAGVVPMAHANDGGGSIRMPASCCGLFGLKPTRGRVSLAPMGQVVSGFAVEHVLTRSVRDSAAVLDQIQGPVAGEPFTIAAPPQTYAEAAKRDPRRLRIAYTTASFIGGSVDPESAAAVESTCLLLRDLGHHLEESAPKFDAGMFLDAIKVIFPMGTAAMIAGVAGATGRTPGSETLESAMLAVYQHAQTITGFDCERAAMLLNIVCRQVGAFFTDYDMLVCPTNAKPAWLIGELATDRPGWTSDGWTEHVLGFGPFTMIFNATGQPAMSMPLHMSSAGLPIGIQFVGRFGAEDQLLALAGQIERAQPWTGRRPAIHVERD